MIFVLSEEADNSTNIVIKWINYYDRKFVRVNITDKIEIDNIFLTDSEKEISLIISQYITKNKINVSISNLTAYWYRRGNISLINKEGFATLDPNTADFVGRQIVDLERYVHHNLSSKKHINKITDVYINKIITLEIAKSIGLKIPDTLITKRKESLEQFVQANSDVITKSFKEGFIEFNDYTISGPTIKVEKEMIDDHTIFNYTLFQKCIDKFVDIRVFFFNSKFYAVAIFSQNDESTKIDLRNYNNEKPNRNVPFSLPIRVLKKLNQLVKKLNINSGSIDLILDKNNEFYFIELNPIGQFETTSVLGNYFIEREIAKELINERKYRKA